VAEVAQRYQQHKNKNNRVINVSNGIEKKKSKTVQKISCNGIAPDIRNIAHDDER